MRVPLGGQQNVVLEAAWQAEMLDVIFGLNALRDPEMQSAGRCEREVKCM
jgi:hypothetical protein